MHCTNRNKIHFKTNSVLIEKYELFAEALFNFQVELTWMKNKELL